MIRTLFLVVSILAVAVMPNPAHGGGGGHGHHHRHHHGHTASITSAASSSSRTSMTPISTTHTPTTIRTPSTARRSSWSSHRWSISRRRSQREVVYPDEKYVLYGDGVNQPLTDWRPTGRC